MAKDWTDKEISYLKRYGSTKTLGELTQRFETEEDEIVDKLSELGLHAKGAPRQSRLGNEPLLDTYTEALEAFHKGSTSKAEKLFAKVAEECDQPELAERARQYLRICQPTPSVDDIEDDFLAAVYEKNQGHLDRALEIVKKGGRAAKDERFAYLEASLLALDERLPEAAEALGRAIEMNDTNRVHAFHDPDFAALRTSSDHSALFRAS